jgi:MFS family permease
MHNQDAIPRQAARTLLTRDFVLGFLALFACITHLYALIPTLPLYLEGLGSNVTEIGVLVGIFAASSLVSRLLVGKALLRYQEKSVIMFGSTLTALTFLACILFRPFWPFFVVRVFQGVGFACVDTAILAFIVNIIPPSRRGQGIGYLLMAPTFALVMAPSFGMFIINHYNFTVFFLTCMGLSLGTLLFSCTLKGQKHATPDEGAPGQNTLFLDLKIVIPAVTNFLQGCVWGALAAFFPLYAVKCGMANPGHFFSAIALMLIIGRTIGGRILDTYSKEKIILLSVFAYMVALGMLAFSTTFSMFIFVGLLWGAGSAFFYPGSMAYAFEFAGSSGGTAVGTIRGLMDLGVALGPVMMGITLPLTGYRIMFLCLAFMCLINLLYFQICVRKRRVT